MKILAFIVALFLPIGASAENIVYDYSDVDTTITAQIPNDDTKPQSNEGAQVLSAVIDVQAATSRLEITVAGVASAGNGGIITTAVFLDSAATAAYAWGVNTTGVSYGNIGSSFITDTIGRTGAVTVSVRVGLNDPSGGNYITLGGRSGNAQWGETSRISLIIREIPNNELSWTGKQTTGNLASAAPGVQHFLAIQPNGQTPTAAALYSHRYHHHTRVIEHNGRVWVAYTTAGKNEDQRGLTVLAQSSPVATVSFGAPVQAFPYVVTFNADDTGQTGHSIMTRNFQVYGGKLYLVGSVDNIGPVNNFTGLALVAVECKDDGTLGTPFRISTTAYTSPTGWTPPYNSTLGPALFAYSRVFGMWGGSSPVGSSQSPWVGWVTQGGKMFTEPSTFRYDADPNHLLRTWRHIYGNTARSQDDRLWISKSLNGGSTWGGLRRTDIPNVAVSSGVMLSDGRIALVGNLVGPSRDPLYLAIFDPATGELKKLFYVRQGLSPNPIYPGQYKHGAEAYPDIFEGEDYLWVSYSNAKEKIYVSRIPKSGL